jgi:NADPH:quinone reductase-like Zn-dependent oxidoreductase
MLDDFIKAAEAGALKPRIDRTFGFAEAGEAYAYLKSGGHLGKVMIKVDGGAG